MPLNKQKGNMYPWVTHTWNIIKGKCPHDCSYCYMKRFPQKDMRIDTKEFTVDLGVHNFIFVGSSCDMWAETVPAMWIEDTLAYCEQFNNRYLFQSKNPRRFLDYLHQMLNPVLGTTIETNRWYEGIMGKAISPVLRASYMRDICGDKMVSIEPIMDFDLAEMLDYIKAIKPKFVSIGADSGNNHLPEPSPDKLKALIKELQDITTVKIKDNLSRLSPLQR